MYVCIRVSVQWMPSNSRYNKQTAQLATIKQLYIRLVAHTVCIKYMCVCVCVWTRWMLLKLKDSLVIIIIH